MLQFVTATMHATLFPEDVKIPWVGRWRAKGSFGNMADVPCGPWLQDDMHKQSIHQRRHMYIHRCGIIFWDRIQPQHCIST